MVSAFQTTKDKTHHVFPIHRTPQAKEILGERFESNRLIFKGLKYSSQTSIELCRWAIAAGVAKRITFHSARHTHATLLLSHGVDIYTVSKLLGHKHVVSTERYAHITDKLKLDAINKLSLSELFISEEKRGIGHVILQIPSRIFTSSPMHVRAIRPHKIPTRIRHQLLDDLVYQAWLYRHLTS